MPFLVLHEGRFSRIYVGEVVADGGALVARFALKVQSDSCAPRMKGQSAALTNVDVDDLWRREIEAHARLASPQVVARAAVPEGLLSSPPVVHCRKVDRYFHPVCGDTGAVLSVCRDDDFLARCGLVPYTADTWRYLHGAGPDRPQHTFYRTGGANGERPREGVVVRIGAQMFRHWARLVHAAPGDVAAARAAALPCLQCEHRQECYPAAAGDAPIPAEQHLQPVTFYDFRALALELMDFDYGETCDLLGGADVEQVAQGIASPGRRRLLEARLGQFEGPGQWLFAADPSRFAVEVLRQKLTAFLEVCAGVRAVHATLGRPHFGVAPPNVMATLAGGGTGAPLRWGFRFALIDLGSPLRFSPPGADGSRSPGGEAAVEMLEPGPEMREDLPLQPYLAPDLHGQEGQSLTMTVACKKAEGAGDAARLVVEAQGAANLKHFRVGDVVSVAPTAGGSGEAVLWAQIQEIRTRGLSVVAPLERGHPCLAWDGRRFEARLSFHRHFGPPVDLYGLGMLLFRTVLVNDEQPMEDVAAAVGKCLRRLEDELSGVVDERNVVARLQQMVVGKDLRAVFDQGNVLYRGERRDDYARLAAEGSAPFDPGVWQSLLVIAFKLVTRWQGFSYSHSHAESSPFLLRQVCADLEALRRRLHVDLFAAAEREAAIGAACDELLTQLRGDLMSSPSLETTRAGSVERTPAKGFRLVVQREGDPAAPQEFHFDREQVTIGRREVENLVRLNDPMVSSAHAVIELQAEGWMVIDRNSTNGTEVDGIRLPGDVAQPLQDGSVIVIRPFRLTFQTSQARLDATSVVRTISTEKLIEQLQSEFARTYEAPLAERRDGLRRVLQDAREAIGSSDLLARLEEVGRRLGGAARAAEAESAQLQAKFFTSAHRSLSQLSRTLLGPGDFKTPEEIQTFAGALARFVETTSQWIERTLELRRALGKHLELGATSTGAGRPSAKTAAEVRQLVLAWSAGAQGVDPTGHFLAKFYDDVIAIIAGLLGASQQVRRAVRERLDPQKLVDLAGREAKFGLLVNAAAGSALWKLYVQTYQEVTEGKQFELELDRLLQKSLQDHRATGR